MYEKVAKVASTGMTRVGSGGNYTYLLLLTFTLTNPLTTTLATLATICFLNPFTTLTILSTLAILPSSTTLATLASLQHWPPLPPSPLPHSCHPPLLH